MLAFWETLEIALGQSIILHDAPQVSLEACFYRGAICETNSLLQFRGLVSNPGTVSINGSLP